MLDVSDNRTIRKDPPASGHSTAASTPARRSLPLPRQCCGSRLLADCRLAEPTAALELVMPPHEARGRRLAERTDRVLALPAPQVYVSAPSPVEVATLRTRVLPHTTLPALPAVWAVPYVLLQSLIPCLLAREHWPFRSASFCAAARARGILALKAMALSRKMYPGFACYREISTGILAKTLHKTLQTPWATPPASTNSEGAAVSR